MILGFSGSRRGMSAAQMILVAQALESVHEFHHGMCKGSDHEAGEMARLRNIRIVGHPGPKGDEWRAECFVNQMWGPRPHLARNRDIVSTVHEMIATPAEMIEQERGGTWYTIRHARAVGMPVKVFFPDGSVG